MTNPFFLRFIPTAFRQTITKSLQTNNTLSYPLIAYPDGRLTRRRQSATIQQDLDFNLGNLGFDYPFRPQRDTKSTGLVDRFERVTGIDWSNPLQPGWKTGLNNDPLLNSQWVKRQLKRQGITGDSFNVSTLINPERYQWSLQLRKTIIDLFDGFF
jgi:hypothetical protein